jgi:hypothetical protein
LRPEARSGGVFAARPEGQDSASPLSWQGQSPNQAVPNRDVSADGKSALCRSATRNPSTAARRGVTGRRDLAWHWGNGRWILGYRGVPLLCVVPAGPGLWRVVDGNGRRSDVPNLNWAKHAAVRTALLGLNHLQETTVAARPIAPTSGPVSCKAFSATPAGKASAAGSCLSIYKAARQ